MSKLYVTFAYTVKGGTFEIVDTNMRAGILTLIETCLRQAMGAGVDTREPVERDVYEITLAIDLTDDTSTVKSNCENPGLTTGILIDILGKMANED